MKVLSAPISVFVSITYLCNLKCRHCAVYDREGGYNDLPTRDWMNFLRELAHIRVFWVRFSGGEPFARGDIWEILQAAHDLPLRLSINTNATLIDRRAAQRLTQLSKVAEIMVSLDGSCPETHDRLRGEGAFEGATRGIGHLLDRGLPVSLYCTVTRYNYLDLEAMVRLATGWGPIPMKFNTLLPGGRGLRHYRELALRKPEWDRALAILRGLRDRDGGMVSGTLLDLGDLFDTIAASHRLGGSRSRSNALCGCGALVEECAVRPDGWVTPCDRIPGLTAGHIRDGDFQRIWQSSEVFQRFRSRREKLLTDLEACRDCPYPEFCTGGCPAVPYALYGETLARDPMTCYRIYSREGGFMCP